MIRKPESKCSKCGKRTEKPGVCEQCLRRVLDESAKQKRGEEASPPPDQVYLTVLLCLPALLLSSFFVAQNQRHDVFLALVLAVNFTAWMVVIVSALLLMFFVSRGGISLSDSAHFLKRERPQLLRLHLIGIATGTLGTVLWACFLVRDYLNAPLQPFGG